MLVGWRVCVEVWGGRYSVGGVGGTVERDVPFVDVRFGNEGGGHAFRWVFGDFGELLQCRFV